MPFQVNRSLLFFLKDRDFVVLKNVPALETDGESPGRLSNCT